MYAQIKSKQQCVITSRKRLNTYQAVSIENISPNRQKTYKHNNITAAIYRTRSASQHYTQHFPYTISVNLQGNFTKHVFLMSLVSR